MCRGFSAFTPRPCGERLDLVSLQSLNDYEMTVAYSRKSVQKCLFGLNVHDK